ncbi:Heat-labile enterotoxin IIB, A chain [Ophiocordyceps sinensis CO18]|uniref:Heat-labile enterotoxin IIB, A chain n=1 Tax=Ophiocordyceps sinensis (strain Co18 / CGMCC 3.14243) TaxID=911162 RepID=T5A8R5_OPHSC|nr:Heat-labile enterotoxin IIB, A chain [Ophiocordyceps sinensis CO18]
MRLTALLTAVIGLATAKPVDNLALIGRAPQTSSDRATIQGAIKNGVSKFGATGFSFRVGSDTIEKLLPELRLKKPKKNKKNKNKQRPKFTGCKRAGAACGRRPAAGTKFRASKAVGKTLAFTALTPFAQDLLKQVREWDSPIGRAVKYLDDRVGDFQDAIGGEKSNEVGANNAAQKTLIDWAKRFFRWLQTSIPRKNTPKAIAQTIPTTEEGKEEQRVKALNGLLDTCDQVNASPPPEALLNGIKTRCENLREEMIKVESEGEEANVDESDDKGQNADVDESDDKGQDALTDSNRAAETAALVKLKEIFAQTLSIPGMEPCDDDLSCLGGKLPSYWLREVTTCLAKGPNFYWAGSVGCLAVREISREEAKALNDLRVELPKGARDPCPGDGFECMEGRMPSYWLKQLRDCEEKKPHYYWGTDWPECLVRN